MPITESSPLRRDRAHDRRRRRLARAVVPAFLAVAVGSLTACNMGPPADEAAVAADGYATSPAIDFTRIRGVPAATDRASTGGVSWADYDGDGDPDLYVTNGYTVTAEPAPKPNRLYRNDGGELVPVETTPLTVDSGYSSGSTWGDYDNDGDLDVFVSNQRGQDNLLFRNEGEGHFTRVEGVAPVQDGGASYASSWVDVDGDGHLDLHVSNGGLSSVEPDFLYRNNGDGTFARITDGPIVEDSTQSTAALWADYDDDGDPDLFLAEGRFRPDHPNRLYRNDGDWRLTLVAADPVVTDTVRSQGAAWGDCDNDGRLDLYVTARGPANRLYINDGNGGFRRAPSGPPVVEGGITGSAAWADTDNDGDLDLVVNIWGAHPRVYENRGGCTFRRIVAGDLGRQFTHNSSLAWADYDGDGDLDLYLGSWPNWEGAAEENLFYRNDGADGHWLKVRLVGTRSNRSAIGARVTAHATIEGAPVVQVRERAGATTFRSQDAGTLHFGLGDADAVERLEVRWPSGAVDTLTDVPADRAITITEGGRLTTVRTES